MVSFVNLQRVWAWLGFVDVASGIGLDKNDEDFDDTLINQLINERNEARKLKNFEKADEIRQNLKNKNIEIEDTKDGTVWTKSK